MQKTKIAIFASGTGSNAKAIIDYAPTSNYEVDLIVSNKKNAGVFQHAENYNINAMLIDREHFYQSALIVDFLKERDIELIILAGFLWHIPDYLIIAYPKQILNIHPSLLPKYGGKGMYGKHVHQAVFDGKEKESGITIHLVNEEYDQGKILVQKPVALSPQDNPNTIASKVLKLEHLHYPQVIEKYIENNNF